MLCTVVVTWMTEAACAADAVTSKARITTGARSARLRVDAREVDLARRCVPERNVLFRIPLIFHASLVLCSR
jgi:hypothetical protein